MKRQVQAGITRLFTGLGISWLVTSCGVEGEKSRQSHVIGQTSVARPALSSCQQKASKAHPTVNGYIKKIVDHIIEKNPGTFKGNLSSTAFCVQFVTDDILLGNTSPNASAEIASGLLTFNGPVILGAPNDAAFAAVVAHELAHVTMDHSRTEADVVKNNAEYQKLKNDRTKVDKDHAALLKSSLPRLQSLFAKIQQTLKDPDLVALRSQVSRELTYETEAIESAEADIKAGKAEEWVAGWLPYDYSSYLSRFVKLAQGFSTSTVLAPLLKEITTVMDPIEKLKADSNALRDQATALADRLLGGKDASANWREQEADEVGYEFYLRAGFTSSQYTWIHNHILRQSRSDAACEELLAKKQIPERGRQSHPQSCWRIYDIDFLESEAHKQDYAPLLAGAKTDNLVPGELDKVKTYIQGLK